MGKVSKRCRSHLVGAVNISNVRLAMRTKARTISPVWEAIPDLLTVMCMCAGDRWQSASRQVDLVTLYGVGCLERNK
jgi:hypothetical protein